MDTPQLNLHKATVSMDGLTTTDLPCYTDGRTWNGFGMPWFDAAGVAAVKELSDAADMPGEPTTILIEGDTIRVYDHGEGEYFEAGHAFALVGTEKIKIWMIGECWTWDACEIASNSTIPTSATDIRPARFNDGWAILGNQRVLVGGLDYGSMEQIMFSCTTAEQVYAAVTAIATAHTKAVNKKELSRAKA